VRARADGGQAVPIVVGMVAVALLAALLLAELGRAAGDRARARTAADVAALGGAAEGQRAARDLARANGATLERFVRRGDDVEVTVRVGRARASARARRETVTGLPYTRLDVPGAVARRSPHRQRPDGGGAGRRVHARPASPPPGGRSA
jgi:hypothetical protein